MLRIRQFASDRSLWLDETLLALNILRRTPRQLLLPLDNHQHAPLGFLLLEKLAVQTLGSSEAALRLVPLIGGLLALAFFVRVGKRILPPAGLLIATALFAVSAPLVYYSGEVKQYSTDVAVALLLLAAALPALEDGLSGRRAALLGAAGATAIWFSHPAVFVLAGLGLVLIAQAIRNRDRAALVRTLAVGALWLGGFAVAWAIALRHSRADSRIAEYWQGSFAPIPPRSLRELRWFPATFLATFRNPAGMTLRIVAALAFLAGSLLGFRGRRALAAALLLPAAFALLASGVRSYPFNGRFLLFYAPSILLLVGEGFETLARRGPAFRSLAGIFGLALLLQPGIRGAELLLRPERHQEIKAVLKEVRRLGSPEDFLYGYRAGPAFDYYLPRLGFEDWKRVRGSSAGSDLTWFSRELAGVGNARVWMVFGNLPPEDRHDPQVGVFLRALDAKGRRLVTVARPGAAAYLYARR